VSRYQKGKTSLDFTGARDSEWQWHQLGHMQVCTLLQTENHASTPPLSFLQAGCPSCRPTNSVKALKASRKKTGKHTKTIKNLFKSKKTTYNKRLATKTVADWELKAVVSRAEPVRIAFDWRELRMQTVDWGKQHFKKSPIHAIHNRIMHASMWEVTANLKDACFDTGKGIPQRDSAFIVRAG